MNILAPAENLVGLAVKLPDLCRCGHDVVRVGRPAGRHLAELRCTWCQRHRGWLPRIAHQCLIEIVNKFGRPDTPICIRRSADQLRSPPTPQAECVPDPAACPDPETEEFMMVERHQVFAKKYWSAPDLKKPIVLEIEAVNVEVLKARDGTTSRKPVVYFRGTQKALVVNGTNFDLITDATGEGDTDRWPDHQIELYATTTPMGGQMVPCVRVRAPSKAKTAKAKTPASTISGGESEDPGAGF
jgi:hypothetical protein